jgi:hypothetical protein
MPSVLTTSAIECVTAGPPAERALTALIPPGAHRRAAEAETVFGDNGAETTCHWLNELAVLETRLGKPARKYHEVLARLHPHSEAVLGKPAVEDEDEEEGRAGAIPFCETMTWP